jgi:DNA-binding MarR family transcriptional regulator
MTEPYPHSQEITEILAALFVVDDMTELALFHKLKWVANLMGHLASERHQDSTLSPARLRLLMHLKVDRELGRQEGLAPSELSDVLGVSRNTVSALLNGLEAQELIERHLHPTDRRQFRIRITQAGEAKIEEHAPQFAIFVRRLFAPLSPAERETLLALLNKLLESLVDTAATMGLHTPQTAVNEEA